MRTPPPEPLPRILPRGAVVQCNICPATDGSPSPPISHPCFRRDPPLFSILYLLLVSQVDRKPHTCGRVTGLLGVSVSFPRKPYSPRVPRMHFLPPSWLPLVLCPLWWEQIVWAPIPPLLPHCLCPGTMPGWQPSIHPGHSGASEGMPVNIMHGPLRGSDILSSGHFPGSIHPRSAS